jgi:integrase
VETVLDQFELSLRRTKLSANTIRSYLKHLKVALTWATDRELLQPVKMKLPDAPEDQMKGRPLTQTEFDSMLMVVPSVVGENNASDWKHFLMGVWLSGLRRSEALRLSWDDAADFSIDLSGLYPRFKIRSPGQKSRKSQYCSMAPDFSEFILANTAQADRTGPVFCAPGKSGTRLTESEVGRRVAEIAVKAEVFTDSKKEKPAGCHDFRRSFGTRWSRFLMPVDLKSLMRHKNIETTMKYYVTTDADDLSARMLAKMQTDLKSPAETQETASE